MKTRLLTLLAILVSPWAFAQLQLENTGTTQGLWGFGATPSGKSFVVGNSGTLLAREAACQNWQSISAGTSSGLRGIAFVSDSTGVAVGVSGTIVRTTDGGNSWATVPSGVSSGLLFVKAWGTQTFYAGGGGSSGNLILRSVNQGLSWDTLITTLPSSPFDAVILSDSVIITCGVQGTVFRSSDAGQSWTRVISPVLAGTLGSIYFIDEQTGFIAAQNGNVFKTTDGGFNWTTTPTGTTQFLNAVFADQQNTLYAVGNSATFITSADSGNTWTTLGLPFTTALRVLAADNQGLIIGGNSGLLFRYNPSVSYNLVFREDFCAFTDPLMPVNGWSSSSSPNPLSLWRFNNPMLPGLDTLLTAPYALYDAQLYGNTGPDSAVLGTDEFSTTGYNQLSLRWRESFAPNQDGETRTIIEGWDGTNWLRLYQSSGMRDGSSRVTSNIGPNSAISVKRSIDISALGNRAVARLRFIYTAQGSGTRFWWAIDDIEVISGQRDLALSQLSYNDSLCTPPPSDDLQFRLTNQSQFPVYPVQLAWQIANGPVNYQLFNGVLGVNQDTMLSINGVQPAAGNLLVWLEEGFDANSANDTLTGFYGAAALSFNLGDSLELCDGDSILLSSGVNADQYLWNGVAGSDSLWVSSSGWYKLEVIQAQCSFSDSVWIELISLPTGVLAALPASANQNDTLILPLSSAQQTRYLVQRPDGSSIDSLILADWHLVLADSGQYQISLTVISGPCNAQEQHQVQVIAQPSTNVSETTALLWKAYPNPANDFVNIETPEAGRLYLRNLQGQLLYAHDIADAGKHRLALPALPAGIYLLQLQNKAGLMSTKRLLIQ
ncbi:MAG: YCF48-related protein [Bacteroidia bacterium]